MTSVVVEPLADAVAHLDGHLRIDKVGRSDFYCGGSCHEELDCILGCRNAPKTYNRYLHRLGHLPHHAQSHGLDGWSAQSASGYAEHRSALLDVDGHAHKRIDKRHAIGTLGFSHPGNVGNVGYVWRKLHYQGLAVALAHCPDHAFGTLAAHSEGHAALAHIGA